MIPRHTFILWLLPIGLIVSAILFQSVGLVETLRFERQPIENGQWWRFITGNLVHLSWNHALLNIAGLIMVWLFFGRDYTLGEWLLIMIFSSLSVTVGLFLLNPHLVWYVGLSGLLHGLFIAGAIRVLKEETLFASLMLLAFSSKLAYEQLLGSLPGSSGLAGGPVVVDSHLYGAIAGAVIGILLTTWQLRSPSQE